MKVITLMSVLLFSSLSSADCTSAYERYISELEATFAQKQNNRAKAAEDAVSIHNGPLALVGSSTTTTSAPTVTTSEYLGSGVDKYTPVMVLILESKSNAQGGLYMVKLHKELQKSDDYKGSLLLVTRTIQDLNNASVLCSGGKPANYEELKELILSRQ